VKPTREAQLRKPFASPFFLYFLLSPLCATLCRQWRGARWTSVAALAIFVGLGIYGHL
jgi:VanZ family protein